MVKRPRVAIFGLHLEANTFCPPTIEEDFRQLCWVEGDEITSLACRVSSLPSELSGFYSRMDERGPWEPVPLIVAAAPPGGPIDSPVFDKFFREMEARLKAALPVDAVYIANHGACSTVNDDDPDGRLVAKAREIVGQRVPIVVTHDLHCNVSEELVSTADALITYRTNPHVDMRERAAEAADLLHEIFNGTRMTTAFIRLPLVPPSVTLLTSVGPYADAVREAEKRMDGIGDGPVANVSISGGFAHSDLSKCGVTVNVTTRDDSETARTLALELAERIWADRSRYVTQMVSVEEALNIVRSAPRSVVFADVADNPGGGGRGNTAYMLQALHEAKIQDAAVGVFVDPDLAAEVHALEEGQRFKAIFNRKECLFSERFEAEAEIVCLTDGHGVGRRGNMKGRQFNLGPSATLRLIGSGVLIVVGSMRRQLNEPRMLEMHGIDIAKLRCLVVKSRGHFRAGFDEFFSPDRIFELDAPGMVSANFSRLNFKKLPRPVAPIDHVATPTFEVHMRRSECI